MIIQGLLIAAVLLVAWYALRDDGARGLAVRRLLGCVVAAAGVLAVLWPDALTALANLVGVRRGADLLLYGLVVVFGVVSVSLYARLRVLDEHITVLVREVAIRDADRAVARDSTVEVGRDLGRDTSRGAGHA